jgi:hypothetical protein
MTANPFLPRGVDTRSYPNAEKCLAIYFTYPANFKASTAYGKLITALDIIGGKYAIADFLFRATVVVYSVLVYTGPQRDAVTDVLGGEGAVVLHFDTFGLSHKEAGRWALGSCTHWHNMPEADFGYFSELIALALPVFKMAVDLRIAPEDLPDDRKIDFDAWAEDRNVRISHDVKYSTYYAEIAIFSGCFTHRPFELTANTWLLGTRAPCLSEEERTAGQRLFERAILPPQRQVPLPIRHNNSGLVDMVLAGQQFRRRG